MEMNWMALAVASVLCFFIGFLWYGPLFGKKWAGYMGMTQEDMEGSGPKDLLLHFATTIVTVAVHLTLMQAFAIDTLFLAVRFGVAIWLGYYLMREVGSVIWSKNQERGLLWINGSYWLVIMLVVSLIHVVI